MLLINNEIDLGKSFEHLKKMMDLASERVRANPSPESYALNYGFLSAAVNRHLSECVTDNIDTPAANKDDLKDINI